MDDISDEKQKIISEIVLINADADKECILKVLNETDVRILKYLKSITVYDEKKVPETITKVPSWGVMSTFFNFGMLTHAHMYIVSSKFRSEKFLFEHTLKHELGHLCGWMKSPDLGNSESFANDYTKDPEEALYREVTTSESILSLIKSLFK